MAGFSWRLHPLIRIAILGAGVYLVLRGVGTSTLTRAMLGIAIMGALTIGFGWAEAWHRKHLLKTKTD